MIDFRRDIRLPGNREQFVGCFEQAVSFASKMGNVNPVILSSHFGQRNQFVCLRIKAGA